MQVTIKDVSREPPRLVTGTLVKEYPQGITIDDARGIRYYVFNHNVVNQTSEPMKQGSLF